MTRKDYVAIAEAMAQTRPIGVGDTGINADYAQEEQWTKSRRAIADVFAADNPRFDRARFYTACEEDK